MRHFFSKGSKTSAESVESEQTKEKGNQTDIASRLKFDRQIHVR